jgi:hypothetical protein
MDLETLTGLFGWSTILGFGLLAFMTAAMTGLRSVMVGIHQKMFRLDEADLDRAYFRYLAQFKVLVIVFGLLPYLALKVVG